MCLFVILHFSEYLKKYQQECGSRVASAGFRQSTSKASPKLSSLQSVGTLKTHGFYHRKPFGSLYIPLILKAFADQRPIIAINCHCLGFSKPVRFPLALSVVFPSQVISPTPGMMMALPRLNLAADLHPKGPRPRPLRNTLFTGLSENMVPQNHPISVYHRFPSSFERYTCMPHFTNPQLLWRGTLKCARNCLMLSELGDVGAITSKPKILQSVYPLVN